MHSSEERMPVYGPHAIEAKWQKFWGEKKTFRAPDDTTKKKLYVLDMFPYPSGEGLHVGHPEGYTATDMYSRFQRLRGFNVLHPMGYDAFGLPAEQYAIETGTHPRLTTEKNISNIRRQIKELGFSYDWEREFATTDPEYFRWTQWIFLLMFDTWFDRDFEWKDAEGRTRRGKGRPIAELPIPDATHKQGNEAVRRYQDSHRLAFQAESPVNWCEALGTVLADEEVINGRSERGSHPVQRIPLRQWMLLITAYADRLVEDLDTVQWPEPIKEMQRNWVGRSEGAEVDFPLGQNGASYDNWLLNRSGEGFPAAPSQDVIRVYTTRPDTLFGATYMILAPEHPLVARLTTAENRDRVEEYCRQVASMSEEDRIAGRGNKTGIFTGGHAINPVNGERIPIWIADYVLISYGTGAIMAVPGHDQRDLQFAQRFDLPIRAVVLPPESWLNRMQLNRETYLERIGQLPEAFVDDGHAIQSANQKVSINGLPTAGAKHIITEWLAKAGIGKGAVKYKLRDWLFSRQRYWGEPIPILHELDSEGRPTGLTRAVSETELPLLLPELEDFKPTGRPGGPLEKATSWLRVKRDGREYLRETNTMPQWAGSCWYYLRFCDPGNNEKPWSPELEKYWMPVDLYVGGAEHAVLHLLYSRFWHKVLFDRGYVTTMEPFQRLVNQGMILSITYRTSEGRIIPYTKIRFEEGKAFHAETGEELSGETEKMSKSRGNVIPVDVPLTQYGADTTRLYEMFMGPLEATKPWSMQGVEGISRFLNRAWRMIVDEEAPEVRLNSRISSASDDSDEPSMDQLRVTHKTIRAVTEDMEAFRFNTAISRLMELVNFFTGQQTRPRSCMETFVLLLAPMAPHIAEELWRALGHSDSITYHSWPACDEKYTREDIIEVPVQINGRLRSRLVVSAAAGNEELQNSALADARVRKHIGDSVVKKVIVVPKKLINIVVSK
jgi:leucyl-tRNA synthetase